jgi:DNA-binding CsgD family transcriptional regulator
MLDSEFEEVRLAITAAESIAPDAGCSLRSAARLADERATDVVALSEIWRQLALGALEIVDDFVTWDRCYLVVRPEAARRRKPVETRAVAVLERILVAGCQKVAALELDLAPSSVAQLGRTGLFEMGLSCRVPSTPYILAAAANASHRQLPFEARSSVLNWQQEARQILSVARPEKRVCHLLSRAVLEVTTCLLEGKSRACIARARKRSERTVSNQLAVAFKQLHAASRLDLLRVLAQARETKA